MSTIDGSTLVARALKEQGAEAVFTVAGGPVIEATGACGHAGVRPIGAHHEQAAVMMALAHGYVRGAAGVALLASGPAVTNGITGAHVGWDNCWPVVILGGSAALDQRGRFPFQEADQVTLMRPVTKWSIQVDSAARVPEVIGMAFRKALSGRPGPVYIDLPADVLRETIEEEDVRPAPKGPLASPPLSDPTAIEQAAELLLGAERPLAVVGEGVRWSNAHDDLRELIEVLGVPFLTSPMGRGFIPDDHRLSVASARGTAIRGADVVLVLGARLNWIFGGGGRAGAHFAPEARLVHVDVEPEEVGLWRDAEVAITGDPGQVVRQLLAAVAGRTDGLADERQESPWQHDLRETMAKNAESLEPLVNSDAAPMTHHRLMRELRDFLPRETIITVDGQITLATGRQLLPSFTPASRLDSGHSGCMGVGVPFAIGAALGRPGVPVLSLNGDAAFSFNGLEVETALRYRLPIVFVVDNNQGIVGQHIERSMFEDEIDGPVAMFTPEARYDRVIEAFGGHAEHVERPEEIRPALERAFGSGKTALVNVVVDPAAWEGRGRSDRRGSQLLGY